MDPPHTPIASFAHRHGIAEARAGRTFDIFRNNAVILPFRVPFGRIARAENPNDRRPHRAG